MKKMILLLVVLFSASILAEGPYLSTDGNLQVDSIKDSDGVDFVSNLDNEPESFNRSPFNIKDFKEFNPEIKIVYNFNATNIGATDFTLEVKAAGEIIKDELTSTSGTITFNLNEVYSPENMPLSSKSTNSFELVLTADYTNSEGAEDTESITFKLYYDTVAPEKPKSFTLSPGEKSITVNWTYPDDTEADDYAKNKIFYVKSSENTDDGVTFSEEESESGTSFKINNLENNVEYSVKMLTIDFAGNESEETEIKTASPIPSDDFYEYYEKNGGTEDGGHCFIATAAYGSYNNGMVKILRNFRDSYLPKSVIDTYYKYSPPLANVIANSKVLSFITRIILEPFVIYANFFLHASLLFKFLILAIFSLLLFVKVKVRLEGVYNV